MANDRIEFSEHPEYPHKAKYWERSRVLYEGDEDELKKPLYLIQHEQESHNTPDSTRLRYQREQRTYYLNLSEPIVSRFSSLFFKKDPVISPEVEELFGDYIDDVTGTGKSLISFLKEDVLLSLLLYGRPIIFTETYPVKPESLGEQEAKRLAATFEVLSPLSVKDWEIEASDSTHKGKFRWLRCEYELVEPRMSAREVPRVNRYAKVISFDAGTYTVEIYRLKRNPKGELLLNDWELYSTFTKTGVPSIPVKSIENEYSWMKDANRQILKLYNLESGRDNIHHFQTYQRIFIVGDHTDEQKKAMTEYTVSFLAGGASVTVIEPVNTASLDANIERTLNNVFKVAYNQSRSVAADSKLVESSDTQQEGKEQLAALIKSEIENLENLANQAIKDWAFWATGNKDFGGKIEFYKDIEASDIDWLIASFTAFRDEIRKRPKWTKQILKKIAGSQDLQNAEEVIAEIEATPDDLATGSGTPGIRNQLIASLNGEQTGTTEPGEDTDQASGISDQ